MASVTYKIGGKYDGKALKSAKKDFSDLATIVKGFAVVKVAQQLNKLAQSTKGVFVEQNKALTSFNTAVAKSSIELQKINNIKKQLSFGNFIDDDSLNNAMKYGIQMGLNAEQLEKVTKASVNMASAGIKPLDKAVKELTKTALTNSDELDKMVAQYDGFAESMSQTFSGRDAQWKNSMSDLKASIGGIFKGLEFITQGKLLTPLNEITSWIVDNRNNILKFILNLPAILKTVLKGIASKEFLFAIGSGIYDILKTAFTESFKLLATLIDTTLNNITNGLYAIFEDTQLGNLIKNVLSGNGGKDQIERQKKANQILQQNGINAIQSLSLTDEQLNAMGLERIGGKNSHTYATKREQINFGTAAIIDNIEKLASQTTDTGKALKTVLGGFWTKLETALDNNGTLEELRDIINNSDLPEDLKVAFEGLTITTTTDSDDKKELTPEQLSRAKAIQGIGTTALGGLGEIGSIVSSALQGGIWGVIAELLGKILSKVAEVSPIFDYFQNIFSELLNILLDPESGFIQAINKMIQPFLDGFNAVKDIFGAILEAIGGIINSITPFLAGLTMILNRIAPIIASIFEVLALLFNFIGMIGEMLNPILEVILDVVAPVLEFINQVIKAIYRVIATIVNVVIDIYNKLTRSDKDNISTTMKTTSSSISGYQTFNPDLSGYATASATTTSGSATYQAAKDIYVNISFEHSFVNGDAREIALQLRDEIRSAEKLGY